MLLSLLRDLTMVGDKHQDETFHNGEVHPPKNQRKEYGPLEPSISLHTTNEGGKVMGVIRSYNWSSYTITME